MNATTRTSRLLSSLTALALCVALASMVDVQRVHAVANPPLDAPAVSLIGDSTMAAMQWYASSASDTRDIIGNSYKLTFDAESCRRIIIGSCRGRFGSTPASVLPLMRTTLKGKLGEALVVMAGYDDPSLANAIDQVMAEAAAQGVIRVLWLNYRTNTQYVLPGGLPAHTLYDSHNVELTTGAQRHPDLKVLDWDGFTAAQPTWFADDGIHLTPEGTVGLANFIKNALDAQPAIGRCRSASALTGSVDVAAPLAAAPTARSGFVPIAPQRVLDTRDSALGGAAGKLGAGRTVSIDVGDIVPENSIATVFSVTAVESCLPGYLTVFACGGRPQTSNINYEFGRTTAGLAITPMTSGKACIYASTGTDLVVDVMGAFTPDGAGFHPLPPTRWIDTRGATVQLPTVAGVRRAPTETQLTVGGQGQVPANATAVWLNLTVADPTLPTVLAAYPGPCGSGPLSSNVNARAQRSMASSVLVGLGTDGSVCVKSFSGSSHIVVDVAGWFGPGAGGLSYRASEPQRLLDTRSNGGQPSNTDHALPIDGISVLNVVGVDSTGLGFVSVKPCGSALVSSLINTAPNEDTANITAVGGDADGMVCVRASVGSHLVVDRVATFIP